MNTYKLTESKPNNHVGSLIELLASGIKIKLIPIGNHDNIIYKDTQQMIILEKSVLVNRVVAIKDYKYENKFLILFNIFGNYTSVEVYGFFAYFDEKGFVVNKVVVNHLIVSYDHRNVNMGHDNMFLYHDHFLFLYQHRDTKNIVANFILFDDRNIKVFNTHYFPFGGKDFFIYHGHVVFKDNNKYKLIDLQFDTEFLIKEVDDYTIVSVVEKDVDFYEGYPLKCGRCNENGKIAIAYYGLGSIGFGNCFCDQCMIKYSKSRACWECCKNIGGTPCFNQVNYVCEKEHDGEVIMKFNKTYIPPYLMNGSVEYK